jgi:hypothetical protein
MGTTTVTAGATNSFGGSANSTATGDVQSIIPDTPVVGTDTLTSSEVNLASGAGLVGTNSTSAAVGLQGTSLDFVGASGTTVTGDTLATAGGAISGTGDSTGALSVEALTSPATDVAAGVADLVANNAAGIAFSFDDGVDGIELATPSLGGGVIEVTGTTAAGLSSGFFSATGSTSFGQIIAP